MSSIPPWLTEPLFFIDFSLIKTASSVVSSKSYIGLSTLEAFVEGGYKKMSFKCKEKLWFLENLLYENNESLGYMISFYALLLQAPMKEY